MPAVIKIKADFKKVKRWLTKVEKKQIPFATAKAITQTLQIAKRDVIRQLNIDIDRPTSFTRRGFRVERAEKSTLTGRLFILPKQNEYLRFQIFGGLRLPKGQAITLPPAKKMAGGVRRDKFGNVPRAQRARQLLAKGAVSASFGGVAGIWKIPKKTKTGKTRKGQRTQLMLAYTSKAVYRKRYRFFESGQRSIQRHWPDVFAKSFRDALRTAR